MGEYFKPEELKTAEEKEVQEKEVQEPLNQDAIINQDAKLIKYEGLDIEAKLNFNVDQILECVKGISDAETQDLAVYQVVQNIIVNGTSEGNYDRIIGRLEIIKQALLNNYYGAEITDLED